MSLLLQPPGVLSVTHRQIGDTVVYKASQSLTRGMALTMLTGKPVITVVTRSALSTT